MTADKLLLPQNKEVLTKVLQVRRQVTVDDEGCGTTAVYDTCWCVMYRASSDSSFLCRLFGRCENCTAK
jgi:hypothetical protein